MQSRRDGEEQDFGNVVESASWGVA